MVCDSERNMEGSSNGDFVLPVRARSPPNKLIGWRELFLIGCGNSSVSQRLSEFLTKVELIIFTTTPDPYLRNSFSMSKNWPKQERMAALDYSNSGSGVADPSLPSDPRRGKPGGKPIQERA